ncbi:MAG: SufS family cysteine desulfurase [Planctomycetaceae bacterium]|nr:SufS family cysteine desulfurase [Planctomycetales bacterium]MCB9923872.1 SufS family cysteine desulfurase [Planctomycetaceae bacterium]
MSLSSELTIEEIIEDLEDLDDRERIQQLEEWGRTLPELPEEQRIEANKVHGCQSQVWLVAETSDDANPIVTFLANSDAGIVNAMIYLLRALLSGKPASEILEIDVRGVFEKIGLERQIGVQRKNGLNAMYQRIRSIAAQALKLEHTPQIDRSPKRTLSSSKKKPGMEARRDFPIFNKTLSSGQVLTYLDSGSSAQKPQCVIDKEREVYENFYANAYRGVYEFGALVDEQLELARNKVAELINAESVDEVIFTSGSTMSLNLVAFGWGKRHLKPGDEILLNEMEHHANFVPWQQVALQTGAACRFIPLTEDGRLDLDRLPEVLTENTKILAVTGMSNVLGTINPVKELARKAHDVGAIIVVDGAQSVPHLQTDVIDADIDFLAFSAHKLYGPSGVGILYGKQDLLAETDPILFGGHMIDRVYRDHSTWAATPAKFEAGTGQIAQAIALGTAIDYVAGIGFDALHSHEQELLTYAHQKLTELSGLRIYGPAPEHKGAIVSFTIEDAHPEDLAQLLDRRGVFVRHGHHCTMPLHDLLGVSATVRASFGLYTTRADIDALYGALEFALGRLRLA